MKRFERYLMVVTFTLAFLGIIGLLPQIISIFLLVSTCIYLFLGWKLLSPLDVTKIKFLPFLVSYLIAQTIVVVVFGIHDFPMKNEFCYVTSGLLLVTIICLLIFNKTILINYPNKSYIVRLIICIMFSLAPLWMNTIKNA
jgi:hypothetical protein